MRVPTFTSTLFILTVSSSTQEDDFEYVNLSSMKPLPDIKHDPDEWPDGAYTLLMSKKGCPMGEWNRGYISFTWKTPHVMLSHAHKQHCNNYNIATSQFNTQCHSLFSDVTKQPRSRSYLLGPFSEYKMTLNFCQRINTTALDNSEIQGTWPRAYFGVFSTTAGCPQGFHREDTTLILPPLKTWTQNGFLPIFTVNTEDTEKTTFTIGECARDEPIENNATYYLSTNHSTFILLKHDDFPCPKIESYDVWPEMISLADEYGGILNSSRLLQFCYYQPKHIPRIANGGYEVDMVSVRVSGTGDFHETLGHIGNDEHMYTMFCSKYPTCRVLVDMGRSFVIRFVQLLHHYSSNDMYTVHAGNDPWALLRYGGVEIHHGWIDRESSSQFVGRYLLIVLLDVDNVVPREFSFTFLVHLEHTEKMCMFDVGMTDGRINKHQISTSHPSADNIDSVRAYSSGWCANTQASNPYIQVDLLEETVIDGFTIYNWYNTHVNIVNGSYSKTFQLMGTRTFTLLYTSDLNIFNGNMSFHMDAFRPSDEPHSFIFYKQIIARYVRIVLVEPMVPGLLCLRFELHGCVDDAIDRPILTEHNTGSTVVALQILTSPSEFTSVGYPAPYQDGTSYMWIINFANVGPIKLVFKEILLQNYEDKSFSEFWYHCKDKFVIKSDTRHWFVPHSIKHKNLIIESDDTNFTMEFSSCRPYTPRNKEGAYFKGFVIKADLPTCKVRGDPFSSKGLTSHLVSQCGTPAQKLSTLSLNNIRHGQYEESWHITIPKFSVRLSITYFYITCQSGTLLEMNDTLSTTVSYTNCNFPPPVLLSESETIILAYKIGQQPSNLYPPLMMEGFQAIYDAVEVDDQQLLDTAGYNFVAMKRAETTPQEGEYTRYALPVLVYKACSVTFMKCYNLYSGDPVSWQVAGDECWARSQTLVSIKSKEELFVVKYMLRTFKHVLFKYDETIDRVFSTYVVDPNYYTHIGISRIATGSGTWQFVWQDGSPVFYSAWNTDQPGSEGDCVRMSFHLAIQNNTWEVEDCYTQVARYFICEVPVDTLPLPDIESVDPSEYTGKMNKTISGRLCQRWDSMIPHEHSYKSDHFYADGNIKAAENYCRDPSSSGYLWCYTMDYNVQWEKCPTIKIEDWVASEYKGWLSTTVTGRTCQRWDSQYPHWHVRNNPDFYPDEAVSDAANYCRDPMEDVRSLWCFTTDPAYRWDYCKLTDTVSDRCHTTHTSYIGTWNVTHSGIICQRWDTSFPHVPSSYADTDFPDGITKAENYCRDPGNEGFMWCYTIDPHVRWETCYVQGNKPPTAEVPTYSVHMQCTDGKQIASQNICNGIVDCLDAEDELLCDNRFPDSHPGITTYSRERMHEHLQCSSLEFISLLAVCDGLIDCIDGGDEMSCDRDKTECSRDEYQCGDGTCIHTSLMCDFIPHCTDLSDENCDHRRCEDEEEFTCNNGQCIASRYRCNAYINCLDGSDEVACEYCSSEAFHCDLTVCIPKRLVCDGIADCSDRTDERTCKDKKYPTCEYRLLNGLRSNGVFSLSDGLVAECNFDDFEKDGSVSTIFHAVANPSVNMSQTIYVIDILNTNIDELKKFLADENYNCSQTFIQRCTHAVRTVAEIEDPNFENDYQHCRCVALTVIPYTSERVVHACDNQSVVLSDSDMRLMYHARNNVTSLYAINTSTEVAGERPFEDDIEIHVGHIICQNDVFLKRKQYEYAGKMNTTSDGIPCQRWEQQYPHTHVYTDSQWFPEESIKEADNYCRDPSHSGYLWCYTTHPLIRWQACGHDHVQNNLTTLPCGDEDFTYNVIERCMYDTDNAGFILGCRNGAHLQDCSNFTCPDGNVKCPGSYCVPLNYVCDGTNQCPGGDDELACGCNNKDLEIIMLLSADENIDDDIKIRQLAGQFNNRGSIVRLLYYRVFIEDYDPYQNMILKITDTEINEQDTIKREHECLYGVLAEEFMERIRFTDTKSPAIIFLQHGTESETVAQHLFKTMSKKAVDVFRVVIGPSSDVVKDDRYNFVTDITVKSLDVLSSMGSRLFPSLCPDSSTALCLNSFKCSSSKVCITQDKVCDGHVHCPFSDDEMFCDFVCPPMCTCSGYSAYCFSTPFDNSSEISQDMDKRLRVLDLSTNTRVGVFWNSNEDFVLNFNHMIRLNLSLCNIERLKTNNFIHMYNLRSLDLSNNKISIIPRRTFNGLSKLDYLNLYGNAVWMKYEPFAFSGLTSLRMLDILDTNISVISPKTFSGLELDTLYLSYNNIMEISNDAFSGLTVNTIIMESNSIQTFDKGLFYGIFELQSLKSSAYKYCCIRPDYLPESACLPQRDEFSSCDDLMRNSALQTMLWLMGISALLGNIMAIIYRIVYDRQRLKLGYGIFVTHLAVADLFMGVYLLIIAIADASFRQRYIFVDEYWRNSVWCALAGVLSTVSSEASVLFLCLITLDRFIVIKYPFSQLRFTPAKASLAASVAWIISISISVIPLLDTDHFQNRFYTKSGVCVALPLTRDRPPGWLYSVIVFIGVNFFTFIGIAFGQLSIYLEINKISSKIKNKKGSKSKANRRKELIIARNLLLVVATDFLCWFPIGCMGMMAMSGYVIPGEVYAWVAVFILPVNSALNPVLYTLTAILGKRNQQEVVDSNLRNRVKKSTVRRKRGMEKLLSYFLPKKENYGTSMISVEQVLQQNMDQVPDVLLKLTIQLTDCLRMLHKNSMILETLDTSSVLVTLEYGKITGDILMRQQPKHGSSLENRKENMYKLGVIVRRLMACNTQQI